MATQKDCAQDVTKVLNLIGDKWSMLVLYQLKLKSPMRFKECQSADGMSSRTLSLRLSALEKAGLISKQEYSEYPPRTEYTITEKGLALAPVFDAMTEWSQKFL